MQGAKVRVQGAKVRTSISASRSGMQQQHATPTTTTTTDQLRISTGDGGVHDAAIIATCIRSGHERSLKCVHSRYLHCMVVFFLVVVVVVVVVDVCVCGGGGCGSGVAVVVKCTGVSQRKYKLKTKK